MSKTKNVQLKKVCCLLAVFSFVLNFSGFSQVNLVPNNSFEEYFMCPNDQNQVNNCIGWTKNCISSPDYFNSCSNNYSVPNNPCGFQYASTGNAYCGIYTFCNLLKNYREYIGAKLLSPLMKNQKYYISLKVNSANNVSCFTNNIGILFSNTPYYYDYINYPFSIKNTAQCNNTNLITDSTNWVNLSFEFVADSNYQYISIGNYFDDSLTQYSISNCVSAYYYIDDVCLSSDSIKCNSPVSINENFERIYKIYPNPSKHLLIIKVDKKMNFGINLVNFLGEIVYGKENCFMEEKINISQFQNGFYIVKIKTENNIIKEKIIINN